MAELAGKVVLVTGSGRGLGRALAVEFARQGAIVTANDITPINLDETVRRIRQERGQVKDYVFDVAVRMQVQAMVDEVLEDWGRLDVLINNAAVAPKQNLLDLDEWDWRRTLDVNLSAPFFLTQAVGRVMQKAGGGTIINLGCFGKCSGEKESSAVYSASKMGLIGLTQRSAVELARYGIRVNAVCPGVVVPGVEFDVVQNQVEPDEWKRVDLTMTSQVVKLVLFLCSDAGRQISGQVISGNIQGY